MRLAYDDCRRGIVSWQVDGPCVVRVRLQSAGGSPGEWSAPLTDPRGSVSPCSLIPGGELAIVPDDPTALDRPFRVRWHAEVGEEVVTAIWDAIDAPPTVLRDLPDLGVFQRLGISTPYLAWEEEATIWEEGVTIAFQRVVEEGQVLMPSMPPKPGGLLPEKLSAVPSTIERGAIEILAAGHTSDGAAVQASTVLGFLALIFGDEAVGPILHREGYEATPEETRVTMFPMGPTLNDNMIRPVIGVASDVLDLVAEYLPVVLGFERPTRRTDALRVALSSYERAARSRSVLERFLAYFVGTEAIVTAYSDETGLEGQFARLGDDPRLHILLKDLKYKPKDLQRLRKNLEHPSNPERFGRYARDHALPKDSRRLFDRLNGLRNNVAHGNSALVVLEDAEAAKSLVVTVLTSEIGLPSPLPWQQGFQLGEMWASGTIPTDTLSSRASVSSLRLRHLR